MPQIFNGNYIDLIIIIVLLYYIIEAFRHGFLIIVSDFIVFLGSLVLSLRFYKYIALFIKNNFSLNISMANAIGYLLAAIVLDSILAYIIGFLLSKLPLKIKKHRINNFLGILPGFGQGVVMIAFLLTLIMVLPVKPQVKDDIIRSKIGSQIVEKTTILENYINEIFGDAINESLTYFTVSNDNKSKVNLDVKSYNLKVDEKAENELYRLVNEERKKLAIPELSLDPKLVLIARNYADDMWKRKYFSHFSPEGQNVGDRLDSGKINYSFAGENLALAPTTKTAHTGLMNSKGHRENILEPKFKKIGVGVVDNGVYGKIFVQVFTD